MKELIRVRVQYASRQQCCKTHKRPLSLPLYKVKKEFIAQNAQPTFSSHVFVFLYIGPVELYTYYSRFTSVKNSFLK